MDHVRPPGPHPGQRHDRRPRGASHGRQHHRRRRHQLPRDGQHLLERRHDLVVERPDAPAVGTGQRRPDGRLQRQHDGVGRAHLGPGRLLERQLPCPADLARRDHELPRRPRRPARPARGSRPVPHHHDDLDDPDPRRPRSGQWRGPRLAGVLGRHLHLGWLARERRPVRALDHRQRRRPAVGQRQPRLRPERLRLHRRGRRQRPDHAVRSDLLRDRRATATADSSGPATTGPARPGTRTRPTSPAARRGHVHALRHQGHAREHPR